MRKPWVCAQLTALGKTALLLVWDNASWHGSQAVRQWLCEHNQQGNREGQGIRIVRCPLPTQSPWLNPLEAHWVHGKRAVVEPARLLTAAELVERVNAHCGCPYEEPLRGRIAPRGAARAQGPRSAARRVPVRGGAVPDRSRSALRILAGGVDAGERASLRIMYRAQIHG